MILIMENKDLIVLAFAILLVISNLFWFYTVHQLINKLMSRNYGEYIMAEKAKKPQAPKIPTENPAVEMMERQKAQQLNQIMGMI
jgi:hypothetical protein